MRPSASRRVVESHHIARAAFVSAVIYGFYPYRFEHYSHLELQFTQWMPLALLAIHAFVESPRVSYAVLAVLAVIAQLYSSMYYAVFFLFFGGAVFVVLAVGRRLEWRVLLKPAIAAGALALALAVPLARPYLAARYALWRAGREGPAADRGGSELTLRELEVLNLVAEGLTNGEIAQRLWISPGTVRRHLENIYEKLGVHTRTAAVAAARR